MTRYFRFTDGGVAWPERKVSVGDSTHAKQVVVIDWADVNQVKQFTTILVDTVDETYRYADVAKALRKFANPTPPKPDEPTGLGAVVEDAEGRRWVRTEDPECPWSSFRDLDLDDFREYVDIDVVRKLSEGVQS